jgi:hypothetical protein
MAPASRSDLQPLREPHMPKPNDHWKILPHGALTQVTENLYTVTGQLRMPLGETTRRMTVVRLSGGRLAIFSAIALHALAGELAPG